MSNKIYVVTGDTRKNVNYQADKLESILEEKNLSFRRGNFIENFIDSKNFIKDVVSTVTTMQRFVDRVIITTQNYIVVKTIELYCSNVEFINIYEEKEEIKSESETKYFLLNKAFLCYQNMGIDEKEFASL